MTWLPNTQGPGRDALLGMHPEAQQRHKAFLEACDGLVEPTLLLTCRARMAQLLRCREELALHAPERLTELETWYRSASFTDVERQALAFVEQFILDPSQISHELVADLETELGTSAVINFASVIAAYEASIRLSTLLDLDPAS